jgi:hypothetical protein
VEDVPGLSVTLSTTTAHVLAADEVGRPVLVENSVGAGKVWMLTVGESNDVDWHFYNCPGGWKRFVLLNTDWTSAGNAKRVVLEAKGLKMPLEVTEGSVRQVLIRDGIAFVFTTPGMSVTPQESGSGKLTMKIEGVGKSVLRLVSSRGIGRLTLDGRTIASPPMETSC